MQSIYKTHKDLGIEWMYWIFMSIGFIILVILFK